MSSLTVKGFVLTSSMVTLGDVFKFYFHFKVDNKKAQQINQFRVSTWGDENILEMNGGDGCTRLWIDFMPQNYTLKNSQNGKIYVIYILPHKKTVFSKGCELASHWLNLHPDMYGLASNCSGHRCGWKKKKKREKKLISDIQQSGILYKIPTWGGPARAQGDLLPSHSAEFPH